MLEGLTDLVNVPLPEPVTVPPLLLSVSVHEPVAVTEPVIFVLVPLQIVVLVLVIDPDGRGFTFTLADEATIELQPIASVVTTLYVFVPTEGVTVALAVELLAPE